MHVIDTNVASELMRPAPAPAVVAWIEKQDVGDLCLTAISEAELRYGVAIVPPGKRRNDLQAAMIRWLDRGFGERILPFDSAAAEHYAEIASRRRHTGQPIEGADCQIAAICLSHGAVLATRNVRDFTDTGIEIVDPWVAA